MNLATDMGCHSGRATPSLHDTPYRNIEETNGRRSTYLLPIAVQTNRATSVFSMDDVGLVRTLRDIEEFLASAPVLPFPAASPLQHVRKHFPTAICSIYVLIRFDTRWR